MDSRRDVLVCFLVCMLLLRTGPSQEAERSGQVVQPSEQELLIQLKSAAEGVVTAISGGNVEQVATFISKGGLGLDPDARRTPRQTVRRELRRRVGVYCDLFDTGCLRSQVARNRRAAGVAGTDAEPLYSVRDLLQNATTREIKVAVSTEDPSRRVGKVSLYLRGGPADNAWVPKPIFLGFVYEEGKWRLSDIHPYY